MIGLKLCESARLRTDADRSISLIAGKMLAAEEFARRTVLGRRDWSLTVWARDLKAVQGRSTGGAALPMVWKGFALVGHRPDQAQAPRPIRLPKALLPFEQPSTRLDAAIRLVNDVRTIRNHIITFIARFCGHAEFAEGQTVDLLIIKRCQICASHVRRPCDVPVSARAAAD